MGSRRSGLRALPPLPAKFLAYLREQGVDLADPVIAAAFLDGVRAADEAARALRYAPQRTGSSSSIASKGSTRTRVASR
jgi:hypothetical protein